MYSKRVSHDLPVRLSLLRHQQLAWMLFQPSQSDRGQGLLILLESIVS